MSGDGLLSRSDQDRIRSFLLEQLKQFADGLGPEIGLADLEKTGAYKGLADKVNSGLIESFECLEDYKIITVVSAHNPNLKAGGLSVAAVWSVLQDLVIISEHRVQDNIFSISAHLIRMSDSENDSD